MFLSLLLSALLFLMAIREGRWDCASCGSTGVYGRHLECPGCGKPRPKGVRFYLTDDAPVVVDTARLAEARAGADWACEHCGASNRATAAGCGGCGAARGESPSQEVRDHAPGEAPRAAGARPRARPRAAPPARRAWKMYVLGGMAALYAAALGVEALGSMERPRRPVKVEPGVVVSMTWEHTLAVEEAREVEEEGPEVPVGAEVLATEQVPDGYREVVTGYREVPREVERTRRVRVGTRTETERYEEVVGTTTESYVCGTRDMGNGYFEDRTCTREVPDTRTRRREVEVPIHRTERYLDTVVDRVPVHGTVPRYRPHFRYRRTVWTPVERLRTAGDTAAPHPPRVERSPTRRPGDERIFYRVTVRDGRGRLRTLGASAADWSWLRPGGPAAIPRGGGPLAFVYPPDSLAECRRWRSGRGKPPPDSLGCS